MNEKKKDYSGFFHCDKTVRENNSLSDISKLVFGDIAYFYFLATGKCTAANQFFAGKYGKSNSTISNAISRLVQKGYIIRYLDEYKNRTIFVNRSAFPKNNDEGNQIDDPESPPDSDPLLPLIDAPLTVENQKKMDEYFKKKFPNITKHESDEAAS